MASQPTTPEVGLGLSFSSEEEHTDLGDAALPARDMISRFGLQDTRTDPTSQWEHALRVASPTSRREILPRLEIGTLSTPHSPTPSYRSLSPSLAHASSFNGSNPILTYAPHASSLTAPSMSRNHSTSSNTSYHSTISISPQTLRTLPVGSTSMDRHPSTASSHSRHGSLSSVCAPVTAGARTPDLSQHSTGALGVGSSLFIAGQASPGVAQRGWTGYDAERHSGSSSPLIDKNARLDEDDDPRQGAKSAPPLPSTLGSTFTTVLDLPSSILALILAPLTATNGVHHTSPQLNGSTAPTAKSPPPNGKRFSLPVRLLTIAYLVFSVVFLSLKVMQSNLAPDAYSSMRSIAPRASSVVPLTSTAPDGSHNPGFAANAFRLGAVGFGDESGGSAAFALTEWAKKVAGGVRWGKKVDPSAAGRTAALAVPLEEALQAAAVAEVEQPVTLDKIGYGDIARIGPAGSSPPLPSRRVGSDVVVSAAASRVGVSNPLTPLSHTYRFAKMHDKIYRDVHDEIEPFAFRATAVVESGDVTACQYTNEAWLSVLPNFITAWGGPISLVFEVAHSRHSPLRRNLIERIQTLRQSNPLVEQWVDFHLVGATPHASERSLNRTRERFISRPVAMNFHHNLARFFAKTEVVWMVGDARMMPSVGLRERLRSEEIRGLVLEGGDAVVVPTFGFVRDPTGGSEANIPSLADSRLALGLSATSSPWDGHGEAEFDLVAGSIVKAHFDTLPLSPPQWPTKKSLLVSLVSTRPGTPEAPTRASMALYDEAWDLNRGPSNWYLWRKSITDPRLHESPEAGGGTGIGVEGTVGGGSAVYRVTDYDLHYSPHIVISQKGQPWCTERFEQLGAACVYQIYLSGAEMWVVPDEWSFTLEVIEKPDERIKENPALKLKVRLQLLSPALLPRRSETDDRAEFDHGQIVWEIPSRSVYALWTRIPFDANVGLG